MELGKVNKLKVSEAVERGHFLTDEKQEEVILPSYDPLKDIAVGDEVEVFIYKNDEAELIATSLIPKVQLNEFAYLEVKNVNQYGAFLDWGSPKDLFVPFNQQETKMEAGEWYTIFVLKDFQSGRLIGSSKIEQFLEYDYVELKAGDQVDLLLLNRSELGMNAIVNHLHSGLIFNSDIHKDLQEGYEITGYVKQVREDGKIDLVLEPIGYRKSIDSTTQVILDALEQNGGQLELSDKSSPEEVNAILGMSKKAFKRGIGNLYRQKIIEITDTGIKKA